MSPFQPRYTPPSNNNSGGVVRKVLLPYLRTATKGAAVTLGSTVISCVLAIYIEAGAHKVIYSVAPHKYATVAYANGLTQEQLDAVRPGNGARASDIPKQSIPQAAQPLAVPTPMRYAPESISPTRIQYHQAPVRTSNKEWNLEDISAVAMTG